MTDLSIKNRLRAGWVKSWWGLPVLVAVVAVSFIAAPQLDAGEPTWPLWLLCGVVGFVWSVAFINGYSKGPFVEKLMGMLFLFHSNTYRPPAEILSVVAEFLTRWENHPATKADAVKALKGYRIHVIPEKTGGNHDRGAKKIELGWSPGTLRWEMGHALMYAELEAKNDVPSPRFGGGLRRARRDYEQDWLDWRKDRGLL